KDSTRIANQSQIDVAIFSYSTIVLIDLDYLRILAQALAIAHAEIKRRTDNDNHIRLVKTLTPRTIKMMRVARRQYAARSAVKVSRYIQRTNQRYRLLVTACGPHLIPEQHHRTLCIQQQI